MKKQSTTEAYEADCVLLLLLELDTIWLIRCYLCWKEAVGRVCCISSHDTTADNSLFRKMRMRGLHEKRLTDWTTTGIGLYLKTV